MEKRVHEGRGVGLLLDGRREARRLLEEAVRRQPGFPDQMNRLGLLELEEGRPEVAEEWFRKALGRNPRYHRARMNLRLARALQGKAEEAPEEPQTAPPWSETWALEAVERAWRRARAGDLEEALAGLDALGERDLYALVPLVYGAAFLAAAGRLEEAETRLEEAKARSVPLVTALAALAPDGDGGLDSLRRFPGLVFWFPTFGELYEHLGDLYVRNGLHEEGRREYLRSFLVWPLESHFHLKMAELALSEGREEDGIAHLSRAVELEPRNVRARVALGFEYASLGMVDEAILQFEVAAKLQPGYPDVRYNLGLLYLDQGRLEEAIGNLEKALEIHPEYHLARSALAMALKRAGRFDEAMEHYEHLTRQGVRSPDILAHSAEVLMERGASEKARELLESCVRQWPEYPRAYHLLGRLYRRKGMRRKAQQAWRRFLELTGQWEPWEAEDPEALGPSAPGEGGSP
jgi:tetratricopeptide (TPR) repeat protein